MKRKIVYCEAIKKYVNKEVRCPNSECDVCPEMGRKVSQVIPQLDKKKDTDFLNLDLDLDIEGFRKKFKDSENIKYTDQEKCDHKGYLKIYRELFNETSNPIYVLQAFQYAHKEKLNIPNWVIDHFATAIDEYFHDQGKIRFDEFLGLVGYKGQESAYDRYRREEKRQIILQDIALLRLCGCILNEAFEVIEKAMQTPNYYDAVLSKASIRDIYYKFELEENRDIKHLKDLYDLSREDFRDFLKMFPPKTLPVKVKRVFNIKS